MKLELKHLAPYLPYKLMIDNQFDERRIVMNATNSSSKNWIGIGAVLKWQSKCKPILRPLSDLTKEIEVNSETFEPFELLQEEFNYSLELNKTVSNKAFYINLESFVNFGDIYRLYEILFSWHFDVFGLIEKGLAIDINTLSN